ncbi:hypothetical protein AAZX31_12G140100 [Glycine max]|nr:hypothetical protein GmHk_12G035027 [Glycine max]
MDVEDAENEVSVSSAILNLIASRPNEVLSPEDLAWVDSCLVKDSDNSETDWIPLKNALLDIISSQPQSFSTEEVIKIPPYIISSELETSTDEIPDDEKTGTLPSINPFLPTYKEYLKENEIIDFGLNLDSSSYEMEHLAEISSKSGI